LPNWPIDRMRGSQPRRSARQGSAVPAEAVPFATVIEAGSRRLLAAINPAAAAAGLTPGMPLADAFSFVPGLATAAAEPAEDRAALRRLAEWCGRYSPWTAPDGADGIKIETTGSAHLWGGETELAADLAARLGHRRVDCRIAIADTLGAAWALACFAPAGERVVILPAGEARAGLARLSVEALRLDPATAHGLRRVGLKQIRDLYAMPRSALARRFGDGVVQRLDQVLGDRSEPLSPLGEAPARRVRLSFAEPIADPADLTRAAKRLALDLVLRLAREGTGARRLDLAFHRVDGRVEHIVLGTARPSRDPHHLASLFRERLDTIDPGLGVEDMILAAFAVEPLGPEQIGFPYPTGSPDPNPPAFHSLPRERGRVRVGAGEGMGGGVAPLLDRLGNKLGFEALSRIEPRESHIPERASIRVPVGAPSPTQPPPIPFAPTLTLPRSRGREWAGAGLEWGPILGSQSGGKRVMSKPPRPVRLFAPPEPVEAFWLLPDDPPFRFTWRRLPHRVTRADGPERVAEEWWRAEGSVARNAIRDYYRVEDEDGRRFWLFRAGLAGHDRPPRWFIHGLFA
jgi:protein ImuB